MCIIKNQQHPYSIELKLEIGDKVYNFNVLFFQTLVSFSNTLNGVASKVEIEFKNIESKLNKVNEHAVCRWSKVYSTASFQNLNAQYKMTLSSYVATFGTLAIKVLIIILTQPPKTQH